MNFNIIQKQFSSWLKKQKHRDDKIGDLARDYISSKDKQNITLKYLQDNHACDGAINAYKEAKKEFFEKIQNYD